LARYLAEAALASPDGRLRAAYLGASNGDDPSYYSIFQGAMEGLGVRRRRMVLAGLPAEDRLFLESADLILLAGGDPEVGWHAFVDSGIRDLVVGRYWAGALLIGISAGAVRLGWGMPAPGGGGAEAGGEPVGTFRLVPWFVGVHQEDTDWAELERTVASSTTGVAGLGIPLGGAAVVHPDRSFEPVRRPLLEIVPVGRGSGAARNPLFPPAGEPVRAAV
jgi:hypothetical protein